ncbi:uncharacterized protein LOC124910566 [Impatiens glandulifera]|uniref:uncharacterized protein LOC124910566 n=1 Tax=Impatiens glandulifera TaxID=253017 RepID=UPI001FB08C16|nr:uncharacterized protein LOC124910566 [Impatiens glandulifera]
MSTCNEQLRKEFRKEFAKGATFKDVQLPDGAGDLKFFTTILRLNKWLTDVEMNAAICLLRARAVAYPKSYPEDFTILDCQFGPLVTSYYDEFVADSVDPEKPEGHTFSDVYFHITTEDYTMRRGHKASKLKETTNDYISKLPTDILNMITRKLDLKDAVKTSILSKRWKYIWINHPDLIFNQHNVLGQNFNKLMEDSVSAESKFVKYVDQTMQQRFKGDGKINSLCVSLVLGKFFSQSIDRWISCALRKGVETIDLNLLKVSFSYLSISSFPNPYDFPWLLTISEDKGTLKHLRVAGCSLQLVPTSCSMKFDSLISLKLLNVNINDLQLKEVLECCPLLENLSLRDCSKLTHLRNGDFSNNTRLKVLSLKHCSKLEEINLCVDNLMHLILKYCFNVRDFDLRAHNLISIELASVVISNLQLTKLLESCPLLRELSLHYCCKLTHLRIGYSNNTPHLEVLSLKYCLKLTEIDLCADNLISLKLKHVNIGNHELAKFLESCPVLKHLTLHNCHKLTDLRIGNSSNNTSLMFISLRQCNKLEHIHLCADNVDRLEYTGMLRSWSFMKTPRLANALIRYTTYDGRRSTRDANNLDYDISSLALDFPMLKNLILSSEIALHYAKNPKPVTAFLNMRRLVLSVIPFHSEDKLIWVRYILKAFPLLQTLELNLDRPFFLRHPIENETEIEEMVLEKCPNGSITEVKVNGYVGNQNEVDLVKYLLENLTGLRELTISPYKKVYKSFYSCVDNHGLSILEFDKFETQIQWLLTVVPPSVRLYLEKRRQDLV